MKFLIDEDLNVVDDDLANDYSKICNLSNELSNEQLAQNSLLGIYLCSKKSETFVELLKHRSVILKRLRDIKGSTYVFEKLFYECNFYRPFNVLQCYSNEAYQAFQICDMENTKLFLTKLRCGMKLYGRELNQQQIQEFQEKIGKKTKIS